MEGGKLPSTLNIPTLIRLGVWRSDKAMKRRGDESAFLKSVENGWHGIGGLRVKIVQQDNGSRLAGGENALGDGRATRLGPVLGID